MHKKINALSNNKGASRFAGASGLWIGMAMLLLFVLSFSLVACSTEAAPATDLTTTLPDTITVDQAYELYQDGALVLDVRTYEEWDDYHAPNTVLIPLDELENRLNVLPKDEQIVVICRSGNRSQVGREILRANGFEQVTSVNGGLKDWRAAGYPTE